ncbi:MAG: glycosyltransferase [Solirubrobacterales bacterium]
MNGIGNGPVRETRAHSGFEDRSPAAPAPDTPLVDISIPVFGRANYVAHAIESVIAQSYERWQLTISEDRGTTEPVLRAVEPYLGDKRIRYTTPGEHLGNARHKSSLLAQGHGKYVTVLDDDDLWLPVWLARRVEFLEQHTECVLVWAGHFDIDPNGAEVRRSPLPLAGGVYSSLEFVQAMMRANLIPTQTALFRRDAYVHAGNTFDPRFVHINDYELWLRLGLLGPVGFLPLYDSGYRRHPQQRSRQHNRAVDHLLLIDHLDGLLQKSIPDLRLPASVRRQQKADRLLSVALDAAEQGQARLAARRIAAAARLAPRALASRRGLAAIAATVAGKKIRQRIGTMRS